MRFEPGHWRSRKSTVCPPTLCSTSTTPPHRPHASCRAARQDPRSDVAGLTSVTLGRCETATYREWNAEEHIRWRCAALRPVFEQRVLEGAPQLQTLLFWEFETRTYNRWWQDAMISDEVRIPSGCHDDSTSAGLAHLREVVGGPVVYGGYLRDGDSGQ